MINNSALNKIQNQHEINQEKLAAVQLEKFKNKPAEPFRLDSIDAGILKSLKPYGKPYRGDIIDLSHPEQQKEFYDLLYKNTVQFVYVKVSTGELREAFGTLNLKSINGFEDSRYTADMLTRAMAKYGTRQRCVYYDILSNGFRQFYPNMFVKIISVDPSMRLLTGDWERGF